MAPVPERRYLRWPGTCRHPILSAHRRACGEGRDAGAAGELRTLPTLVHAEHYPSSELRGPSDLLLAAGRLELSEVEARQRSEFSRRVTVARALPRRLAVRAGPR